MLNIALKKKEIYGIILPIGHFLYSVPRFYHPNKGWYDSADYIKTGNDWVENNIVIGYNVKSKTGLFVRFKIRPPYKFHSDARKIEKGAYCISKSKTELSTIAEKLKIAVSGNNFDICKAINIKLIYLELLEREKKSNLKYFYHFWECQPLGI